MGLGCVWQSIRNGTIATVVGGLILLLIPYSRAWIISALDRVFQWIAQLWSFIFSSYGVPIWLLTLLVINAALTIGLVVFFILEKHRLPAHSQYIEDVIKNVRWRWYWEGTKIMQLAGYCLSCDGRLVYDDSSCRSVHRGFRSDSPHTKFICENCDGNIVIRIDGGNLGYAESFVRREIDRRVRTGNFQPSSDRG